jgi:hypothetical protein
MSFSIARQIKLRSIEQANFTKTYNRVNFVVTPDGLSTDLSQSYLSMRMYLLKDLTGERVTPAEMLQLIRDNLCVSFGNNDQSYSPASIIRTARLFALQGDELLEEINFSSILTQSIIHQLCNDFETVESSNILTGSSSQIGHGSSFPSSLSAFYKNPTEVHIFLRDLFGICRHSNFELMATGGLRMEFELEDRNNIFKLTTLGDFQQIGLQDVSGAVTANTILPSVFSNGEAISLGYLQNADVLNTSSVARAQFNSPSSDLFLDLSNNIMVQYPKEGFEFPADVYFTQPTAGAAITGVVFKTTLQYTLPQLTALGFVTGAYMKLRYSISNSFTDAESVQPKDWYTIRQIGVPTGGAGASLPFAGGAAFDLWYDSIPGKTVNSVVQFEGLELLNADEVFSYQYLGASGTPTATEMLTHLANQRLPIDASGLVQLKNLGLLDADSRPTGTTFDLGIELLGAATDDTHGVHIMPDTMTNQMSSAIRKVYSSQITKLPAQGAKCRILQVSDADASGIRFVDFSSWGCEGRTSIQPFLPIPTSDTAYTLELATSVNYFIWNVQNHSRGPNQLDLSGVVIPAFWNKLTYEIDKFELVLIQSSVDPKNRMPRPMVYSTWKVEINTVESNLQTWARQFILEDGVYNCFLLTPKWNTYGDDKGSMISTRRGISHYRYLCNNIAQTNRDIYVQDFRSDYVSSLYLDRLNDTFSNSDYILRSPIGIKGVQETADPVVVFPLKIYNAVSETAYKMGEPGGQTVQINLYGDPSMSRPIEAGNVYFFKQLLKQI